MSTEATTRELAAAGFDLVWPFDANEVGQELGLAAFADPARPLGLLVGNTRALWPVFTAARHADPVLATHSDPLERYTEQTIDRVASAIADSRVLYAHRRYGDAFLPFQRLAVAAGAGTSSPTQLVIHPVFGPWFALRAVILCNGSTSRCVKLSAVCTCNEACVAAFDRAMAATGPALWRAWLAVRDACPIGREHRYADDQITYHYSFMHRAPVRDRGE
ncbi:MAG TPA: hypothetical protein VLB44_09295 [Kofleriaceae bacterium]|nr:hypothetical protein [Kofleriaceae bacterium]